MTVFGLGLPYNGAAPVRRMLLLLGFPAAEANARARAGNDNGNDAGSSALVAAYRAVADRIEGAMGLTARQRAARVLSYATRFGPDEVAEAMQISPEELQKLLRASEAALQDRSQKCALILEDDGIFRRHLEECCTDSGVVVVSSSRDPVLSVLAAKVFQPDVALVDLTIGDDELAGDLAAMRIRDVAPGSATVFVTGYTQADQIATQMSRAVALIKPVSTCALTRAIRDAFQSPVSSDSVA